MITWRYSVLDFVLSLLKEIAWCVCQNVHHFMQLKHNMDTSTQWHILWCCLADPYDYSTAKPLAREDTVQTNFLPHKSFPEKSPVNGTSEQPPKTNTGAPAVSSYNRYAPKPYTTSAKPFARMFDSPKFNHNLLPNDKTEIAPKVSRCWPVVGLVWQ